MAIYKYQSAKVIISKVFRDTRIQDNDWILDAIEWIGEAMDAIGTFAQTETKSKITHTYSHSAKLPAGLISINNVYYNCSGTKGDEQPEEFKDVLPYGAVDNHPAYNPSKDSMKQIDPSKNESFIISGGYIKTSFESDWILINYQGISTDKDGFPMVPDNYEFEQALYWYIVHKLVEGGFKHPAGLNYFHVRDLWLKYCGQARNNANMPDGPQMERLREIWVGLLPTPSYTSERDKDELEVVSAANLVTRPLTVDKP